MDRNDLMATIAIRIPSGRWVSAGAFARAWNAVRVADPHTHYKGWDHFGMDAGNIRRDMLQGLMDRINRHDRTMVRRNQGTNERRISAKIRAAAARGAIRYECRWCGCALAFDRVNPNNMQSRFCSTSCARDYWG